MHPLLQAAMLALPLLKGDDKAKVQGLLDSAKVGENISNGKFEKLDNSLHSKIANIIAGVVPKEYQDTVRSFILTDKQEEAEGKIIKEQTGYNMQDSANVLINRDAITETSSEESLRKRLIDATNDTRVIVDNLETIRRAIGLPALEALLWLMKHDTDAINVLLDVWATHRQTFRRGI